MYLLSSKVSVRSKLNWLLGRLLVNIFFLLMCVCSVHGIERISLDSDGTAANNESLIPAISADGRYVAFSSIASNLVSGDTNDIRDIFIHDRETGETSRVSVNSNGLQGNDGDSSHPVISADGRFVAFQSDASDLVNGDNNDSSDIFVHDRITGITSLVSKTSAGIQTNGSSTYSSISADGRLVAFESNAQNLVPSVDFRNTEVFVHDRATGITSLISKSVNTNNPIGTNGKAPALSADGRHATFFSNGLVVSDGASGGIFNYDRETGKTTRVSVSSSGTPGNRFSFNPSISANGRFIGFVSDADNLVQEGSSIYQDAYFHDRVTGVTSLVGLDVAGGLSLSADGRYIVFESFASNLVSGDTNSMSDIFIHDRRTRTTKRINVDFVGTQGNKDSFNPVISAEGRTVVFSSDADNLVSDDSNFNTDIFVTGNPFSKLPPDASTPINMVTGDIDGNGKFDLIIDFGSFGVWTWMNDRTWSKLHKLSPKMMVIGDIDGNSQSDLILDFAPFGLWNWVNNSQWEKLHTLSPEALVTGDFDGNGKDELGIDFGQFGTWLWRNNSTWSKLHKLSPKTMVAGDIDGSSQDDLIIDFAPFGLWKRMNDSAWTKFHPKSPKSMVIGDIDGSGRDDVIINFGTAGLWGFMNNDLWKKLHSLSPKALVVGDLDGNGQHDLVVDFSPYGLWRWMNDNAWLKLHSVSPKSMTVGDIDGNGRDDAIINFGTAGIWVWKNDSNWLKLSTPY